MNDDDLNRVITVLERVYREADRPKRGQSGRITPETKAAVGNLMRDLMKQASHD